MARYTVTTSELTQIADAIRSKNTLLFGQKMTFPWGFIRNVDCDNTLVDYINRGLLGKIYDSSFFSIVPDYMFYRQSIQECTMLNCTTIGSAAFKRCAQLEKINFPNCSYIGSDAFYQCSKLEIMELSNCTQIGSAAFQLCSKLATIDLPNCISINTNAFGFCTNLTQISIPKCKFIDRSVFTYCSNLSQISLPLCSSIGSYAFFYCSNLMSIYLLYSSRIVSISDSYIFSYTPIITSKSGIYGSIYVPSSLLTTYKNATYWSRYAARFVGI